MVTQLYMDWKIEECNDVGIMARLLTHRAASASFGERDVT